MDESGSFARRSEMSAFVSARISVRAPSRLFAFSQSMRAQCHLYRQPSNASGLRRYLGGH